MSNPALSGQLDAQLYVPGPHHIRATQTPAAWWRYWRRTSAAVDRRAHRLTRVPTGITRASRPSCCAATPGRPAPPLVSFEMAVLCRRALALFSKDDDQVDEGALRK